MHCVWQSMTLDISSGVCAGGGAVFWALAVAQKMAVANKTILEMATMFRSVMERGWVSGG